MTQPILRPTESQYRVLVELCRDGADNRTIARRLRISDQTVKTHLRRLNQGRFLTRTEMAVAVLRREVIVEVPESLKPRSWMQS